MPDHAYAVIIPAYNAAMTLQEAIESVLAQTVAASDILVIDDGSTDDTAQIAASFGGTVRVAAGTVGVMLFDELLVGLFDGRGIGPGCKAQDGKCGDAAGHESGV